MYPGDGLSHVAAAEMDRPNMMRAGAWRGVVGAALSATVILTATPAVGWAAPTYRLTDLGTLGGVLSLATGINASGQVVGVAYTFDNAACWRRPKTEPWWGCGQKLGPVKQRSPGSCVARRGCGSRMKS
jgi:hypothetical protein